jgi:hypothetical protein
VTSGVQGLNSSSWSPPPRSSLTMSRSPTPPSTSRLASAWPQFRRAYTRSPAWSCARRRRLCALALARLPGVRRGDVRKPIKEPCAVSRSTRSGGWSPAGLAMSAANRRRATTGDLRRRRPGPCRRAHRRSDQARGPACSPLSVGTSTSAAQLLVGGASTRWTRRSNTVRRSGAGCLRPASPSGCSPPFALMRRRSRASAARPDRRKAP